MMEGRKPTMRDVARLAGVSAMTVSRFLADDAVVADATRARIGQAIEQLGYVPDRVAGSLSSRRSGFIAAILPTLTNSNFADTAVGLTEVIRKANYQLLIGYTMYQVSEEEHVTRGLLARRPEAMVLAGDRHTKATQQLLLGAGIPVVEIWSDPARAIDHGVGFSNFDVGRAAARHLVDLGHVRIGAIGPHGDEDARDDRGAERLAGFGACLREAGVPADLILSHGDVPFSFERGGQAMARLLDIAPDVEAVFAVSDLASVGALMECQRRGVRVPEDVSLMGFGNFEIGAQCVPSLTTVGVDARDIGRRTGTLLMELLAAGGQASVAGAGSRRIDVGFALIERQSTAANRRLPRFEQPPRKAPVARGRVGARQ